MGIVDLFRPKYRHSDAKVRLEAVRALSSDESGVLAAVARTDKDPGVRRVAIEKIEEVDLLAEISERDDDRVLRDLAGARAAAMWVSGACQDDDPTLAEASLAGLIRLGDQRALVEVSSRAAVRDIRTRAQAELREPRALADLARTTTSHEVRQQAMARLEDAEVLRALAIDTTVKELGLLAVDKLTQKEVLEQVAHKAKAKAVRQRARKKLDEIAEGEAARRPRESDDLLRRRAEKSQLLRTIDALAETFEWQKSLDTVQTAESAWAALGDTQEPAVDERFGRAVARYHVRRTAAERQVQDRGATAAAEARARRGAEARAAEVRAARDAVADDGDVVNVTAVAAAEPDETRAARELAAAERREAREREHVEDQTRRDREAAERATRQKEAAERGVQIALSLNALIEEMTGLVESSDAKSIDRILGQAATAFSQLVKVPPAERAPLEMRYGEIRSKLVIQLKDLREGEEWKRWAAVPRAEALITAARALAESEEVPGLPALKDLQLRWKQVGPLPLKRSQELWEQFKTVADAAFARIRTGREVEHQKLGENLKIKEQLVVQAEALAESSDWDATALVLKDLQKQWKESGPAPRREADEMWKRFRSACDRFFERRKPMLDAQMDELRENQGRKEDLIAQAEALVARAPADGGWGKAISDIKAMQREWTEIGRVPRSEVENLWHRFRAACDSLFSKRDAVRDADADARRAELEGLRAEIDAISAGGEDVAQRALAVRRKVLEMTEQDIEPGTELRGVYEAMLRTLMTEHGDVLRGTELDPVAMASRRDKLMGRAEALLPKDSPALGSDASPAELAQRLRQAMAANSLFKADSRDPFEVVEELRDEWRVIGPVVGAQAEAQAARFGEICDRVVAGNGGAASHDHRESADAGEPRGRRRDRRDRRPDAIASQPKADTSWAASAAPSPPDVALVAPPVASEVSAQSAPAEAAMLTRSSATGMDETKANDAVVATEAPAGRARSQTAPAEIEPKEVDPVDSGWE